MHFLIVFAQSHETFRLGELQSLADLYGIPFNPISYDDAHPFLEIELSSAHEARKLVENSFLVKAIYEVHASGKTQAAFEKCNRQVNYSKFKQSSFKFDFVTFNKHHSKQTQIDIIQNLMYMGLDGPIKMKNPEVTFYYIESYTKSVQGIWLCTLVGTSSRHFIDTYNLKKRPYIGTTSFDAELAFVTCNYAHVTAGSMVYDPFAGTGSFPVAAAHFGAFTFASDIDPRVMRGYPKNFAMYNTERCFFGGVGMDFTHNALRSDLVFDCIVSDPPYGVREGLKVCGTSRPQRFEGKEHVLLDNIPAHLRVDYRHPKKPYSFSQLLDDLLEFAANRLRVGGRLVFWLPQYGSDELDPPQNPWLKLLGAYPQHFNKWSRFLVVYERQKEGTGVAKSLKEANFREQYFTAMPQA